MADSPFTTSEVDRRNDSVSEAGGCHGAQWQRLDAGCAYAGDYEVPPPGEYYMTASWRSKRRCFGFFHGDTTYRNNGGTPCDPAASLRRAINIGVSHGMKYIETYQTDGQRLIIRLVPDVG